jgi:hypothetical protein
MNLTDVDHQRAIVTQIVTYSAWPRLPVVVERLASDRHLIRFEVTTRLPVNGHLGLDPGPMTPRPNQHLLCTATAMDGASQAAMTAIEGAE